MYMYYYVEWGITILHRLIPPGNYFSETPFEGRIILGGNYSSGELLFQVVNGNGKQRSEHLLGHFALILTEIAAKLKDFL